MSTRQHGRTGFTSSACHDQVASTLVQKVDMRVIVLKGRFDLFHHFSDQLLLIEQR
jgi:hypothetical protein